MSASKCALYIRSADYGPGADFQLEKLREFTTENHMVTIHLYEDSGTDEGRPKLEDAVRAAHHGEFNVFVVWGLDRLDTVAASADKTFRLIGDFSAAGIRFVSIRDRIDSADPGGEMATAILKAVERSRPLIKGERVHLALAASRADGESVGRPKKRNDAKIQEMRALGTSIRQIAGELGISTWSVHSSLKKAREEVDLD